MVLQQQMPLTASGAGPRRASASRCGCARSASATTAERRRPLAGRARAGDGRRPRRARRHGADRHASASPTCSSARSGSAPASRTCSGKCGRRRTPTRKSRRPSHPRIRLFSVKRVTALEPKDDVTPMDDAPDVGGRLAGDHPALLGRRLLLRARSAAGARRRADRLHPQLVGRHAGGSVDAPRRARGRSGADAAASRSTAASRANTRRCATATTCGCRSGTTR